MAYPLAAAKFLKDHPRARYKVTLDAGETFVIEALICSINNVGSMGGVQWQPPAEINPYDGLLDLFVINLDLDSVGSLARYAFRRDEEQAQLDHWQSSTIRIEADPPQAVWIDGEPYSDTPVTMEVLPGAVEIVVPE
jgi:diacylglycerol kinase family enzyme